MDVSPLLSALTDSQSELRDRYVGMVADQWLAARLERVLPAAQLLPIIRRALNEDALTALFTEHVSPIVERVREEISQGDETLGEWVSPETQSAITRLVGNPQGPKFAYFSNAVDPALMRRLLSPVFQDVLMGFVSKLPAAIGGTSSAGGGGGSDAGGLLGRLGREVGGRGKLLVDVGRSVMGGLGLEEKLQQLAADFSQQAVGAFRESLQKRLRSDEGRQVVQQLAESGTKNVLQVKLSDVNRDLSAIPLPDAIALLPHAVSYAAERELFGSLLEGEVSRFYEQFGSQSLEDVLRAHHLYDEVRAAAKQAADAHVRHLFSSAEFSTWLSDLLSLLPE